MKRYTLFTVMLTLALAFFVALSGCLVPPAPDEDVRIKLRERIAIDARDDSYVYNGADIVWYTDDHSTVSGRLDGAAGALVLAAPTAVGTATPVLVADSAGVSNLLEVRDAATPVFTINNGGAWSSTGAGTHSSGQTVNNWAVVAAPTAIATATPAFVVNSVGVSNIFEVRDAATPVVQVADGGAVTFAQGVTQSNGDLTVADDFIVTAQSGIAATNGGVITPTGTYQPLTATGTVTPTVTTTGITAGTLLVLINTSTGSIVLADSGTMMLTGAITLGQYDSLTLWFDGTNWIELSTSNN